ncbi:alpha-tocopherol transfer protein-like [Galleria mellonella]|uniref:Alpha-tocopherol transfer protein-like n=1 Tax=Galleria mellonella TaxID=7137 RepID=A0A6J3BWM3_GALME|nr:alpha-tocopherol transfer protein-like [Galleria mellonella]
MWYSIPGQFSLEEEYKKPTGVTPADVSNLRQWLQTQPHLPAEHITDLDLVLAYHCCERSSEVAKQVLDLNLTLKTLFVNLFKDRYMNDKIESIHHIVLLLPLEIRTHDGYAVIYSRLLDYDTKQFVFADCIRTILMVIDLWQYKSGTWPGFVILIDLDKITLGHVARLDLQTMQQFLYFLQEALLVKMKGLHYLNAPPFMDKIMILIKPFLKKDLLDVLHIHQIGSKTLEKFVPTVGLPKEAGGEYKTFNECRDDVIAAFKANKDYFEAETKKRVVESRRPGKPKTISDIFGGVEGSFKKLEID